MRVIHLVPNDSGDEKPKVIKTRLLKDYIPVKYELLRVRLRFLGWEVDVELLEVFAGAAIWIVFSDIINLVHNHEYNNIYDVLFKIAPPIVWIVISGLIGFTHLLSILLDKSCDPKDPATCCLSHLRTRVQAMFVGFLFMSCLTLSVFMAHSYVLVLKFIVLFTIAALWSHIRLRKQYSRLKKKQREKNNGVTPNPCG